ncbi:AfsR/SARP family transcriptional regulator [Streptomyces sp. MAR4 CNX-425]|uniref:AfsR/SARP family transcriptional regulator n=1 Tax=Streptomyces sp. MAR4 CNX-425 TaxID=3406343 RepID=UPI003B507E0E
MPDRVELRVLGPVGVWAGGRRLGPDTAQDRAVLAMLALEAGHVVPVARLERALWGGTPPASARNAVQGRISSLRRLLHAAAREDAAGDGDAEEVGLTTTGAGYRLRAAGARIDLHRFRTGVRRARRLNGSGAAEEALTAALAEWRGTALADVAGDWLPDAVVPALEEERLAAVEDLAALRTAAGRHEEVVSALTPLLAEHPLRERPAALLLTSLYRGGRRAEALETYGRIRRRFVAELGIEPGHELRRAHQAALQDAPVAAGGTGPEEGPPAAAPVPRQLPPATAYFTGRQEELAALDRLLPAPGGRARAVPVTVVVAGTGGVGKTALAVHWAAAREEHFPDGQLYVNLRGFGPSAAPLETGTALWGFLEALGVPRERVPDNAEARVGLYRSLLAGRRMLVVLDNAREAEQVRPLLPNAPGCLTLVTSRHDLLGLVAAEEARPVRLGPLPPAQARELMARRLGDQGVAAEPEAVAEFITHCAGLPLALAIVTARAVARPGMPLSAMLPELGGADGADGATARLDAFDGGDARTDLRTVLSWSYRCLSPAAARLFLLLGTHPVPEIAPAAAASLAGVTPVRARRTLTELCRAHLLEESPSGRYTWHDLLWSYARERADDELPAPERRAAAARLEEHLLHTAYHGDRLLNRHHQLPVTPPPAAADVTVVPPRDEREALAWFRRERQTLLAAVDGSARAGRDVHTWQLARMLRTFLYQQGHLSDEADVHRAGLAAAGRLADPAARAYCHFGLGQALVRLRRAEEGGAELRRALRLYEDSADAVGQAVVLTQLAVLEGQRGDPAGAERHAERSLELCRGAGHRPGVALALNNLGWYRAQRGDLTSALRCCEEALGILDDLGDTLGQAATLDSLGFIRLRLDRPEDAIASYRRSLRLLSGREERVYRAITLPQLAEAQEAAGRLREARDTLCQALHLLVGLAPSETAEVRDRLADLERRLADAAPRDPRPAPGPA